jgi:hypothetical protein
MITFATMAASVNREQAVVSSSFRKLLLSAPSEFVCHATRVTNGADVEFILFEVECDAKYRSDSRVV